MREMSSQIDNLPNAEHDLHQHERASILLEQAVLKANQAVYMMAEREAHYRGMGTTIVAALFRNGFISIAHVGDSRLYRYRHGMLTQLTTDHSVVQELIDCGFCTPEQRPYFPNKNLVTRALGVGETVVVDVQQQPVLPDDIYLLCSDGLNDMLDDKSITTILRNNNHSLRQTAHTLVDTANERGGEDNISVILVHALPSANKSSSLHWLERWFKGWFKNR
jgi:protein phosphatase